MIESLKQDSDAMKMSKDQIPLMLATLTWLQQNSTTIWSTILCFATAYVRSIRNGNKRQESLLDALLCALVWLGMSNSLEWLGIPAGAAGFCSVVIAFLGVDKLREIFSKRAETMLGGDGQ